MRSFSRADTVRAFGLLAREIKASRHQSWRASSMNERRLRAWHSMPLDHPASLIRTLAPQELLENDQRTAIRRAKCATASQWPRGMRRSRPSGRRSPGPATSARPWAKPRSHLAALPARSLGRLAPDDGAVGAGRHVVVASTRRAAYRLGMKQLNDPDLRSSALDSYNSHQGGERK